MRDPGRAVRAIVRGEPYPYHPLASSVRNHSGYTARQSVLWHAMEDVWYARAYDYLSTRQPSPGFSCDENVFREWVGRYTQAMGNEIASRGSLGDGKQAWDIDAIPETAWLYLYERMLAAGH